jgi:hypothetical protein
MTKHDKIEHALPNGDILIVDSTRDEQRVSRAFSAAKADLRKQARDTYRSLQPPVRSSARRVARRGR